MKVAKTTKNFIKGASAALTNALVFGQFGLVAHASGVTNGLDVGTIVSSSSDDGSLNTLVNQTKTLGTAGYHLAYTIMVFVFIIGFLIAFVKLFFSNSSERSDAKSDMIWKIVAGVCGFATVGLVIMLSGVGGKLFPTS